MNSPKRSQKSHEKKKCHEIWPYTRRWTLKISIIILVLMLPYLDYFYISRLKFAANLDLLPLWSPATRVEFFGMGGVRKDWDIVALVGRLGNLYHMPRRSSPAQFNYKYCHKTGSARGWGALTVGFFVSLFFRRACRICAQGAFSYFAY